MLLQKSWFWTGAGALCALSLALGGCRETGSTSTSGTPGGTSSSSGDPAGSTGSGGAGTGGSGSAGSGGGSPSSCPTPPPKCEGELVTLEQMNNPKAPGAVKKGSPVRVEGVIATSRKFLVSQSKASGSCLYGVFVSAPNLTETAPYSGMLVISYGCDAAVPPGGQQAYCPKLSSHFPDDPKALDAIPDDIKPGDVLNVTGKFDDYIPQTCGSMPTDSKTPQNQLLVDCAVERTGTAPLPAPHELAPDEIAKLADQADADFHTQWAGVKVRVANVSPAPQPDPEGSGNMVVVGAYGEIKLLDSNVVIGDKIYYRGYEKDKCFGGPVFSGLKMTWNKIDAIHYLNFCTWGLQTNNKCADFDPASEDCASEMLMCE